MLATVVLGRMPRLIAPSQYQHPRAVTVVVQAVCVRLEAAGRGRVGMTVAATRRRPGHTRHLRFAGGVQAVGKVADLVVAQVVASGYRYRAVLWPACAAYSHTDSLGSLKPLPGGGETWTVGWAARLQPTLRMLLKVGRVTCNRIAALRRCPALLLDLCRTVRRLRLDRRHRCRNAFQHGLQRQVGCVDEAQQRAGVETLAAGPVRRHAPARVAKRGKMPTGAALTRASPRSLLNRLHA